eukprot:1045724-Pyramimonas_sp.AAC.1
MLQKWHNDVRLLCRAVSVNGGVFGSHRVGWDCAQTAGPQGYEWDCARECWFPRRSAGTARRSSVPVGSAGTA